MISVVAAPADYPVDIYLLKKHMVVEHALDDELIESYVESVVSQLDPPNGFLGRAMITQTLQYWLECFPCDTVLRIPFPPLQSVVSVKYYDLNEALQTFSTSNYTVVVHAEPGYIELNKNKIWPESISDRQYPVVIEFIAGYGEDYESIPVGLKHWIMMSVADLYAQREHMGQVQVGHNKFTMNAIENYRFHFYDPSREIRSGYSNTSLNDFR